MKNSIQIKFDWLKWVLCALALCKDVRWVQGWFLTLQDDISPLCGWWEMAAARDAGRTLSQKNSKLKMQLKTKKHKIKTPQGVGETSQIGCTMNFVTQRGDLANIWVLILCLGTSRPRPSTGWSRLAFLSHCRGNVPNTSSDGKLKPALLHESLGKKQVETLFVIAVLGCFSV